MNFLADFISISGLGSAAVGFAIRHFVPTLWAKLTGKVKTVETAELAALKAEFSALKAKVEAKL